MTQRSNPPTQIKTVGVIAGYNAAVKRIQQKLGLDIVLTMSLNFDGAHKQYRLLQLAGGTLH